MSDLLHDVDEMMRAERLRRLWDEYGNYLIGAVLVLIIGVAADQAYQSWRLSRAQAAGAAIQTAFQDQDPVAALTKVAQTHAGNGGAIADILVAQRLIQSQKWDDAKARLLGVRNNAGLHKDLRALATLMWVRLRAADPDIEVTALKAALAPLMQNEGDPFAWAARLDLAVILAGRANDPKAALDILEPMINHPALPQSQTERARLLTDLYKARLISKTKE